MVDDGACCHQRLFANLRALVDTRIVERVSHYPAPHPLCQLLKLSPLFCLLQLREAKGGRRVLQPARSPFPSASASGGLRALGCVRERRLSVRRCRLGTTCSRFWFPPAARLQRRRLRGIRSSPVRPRSVGALLRRRRRACGGRSPCVGDLYRSWSAAACRPRWRRLESISSSQGESDLGP